MTNILPFHIAVFNAVIASFNNYEDAKDYAIAQSIKYPRGWVEVRDRDTRKGIIVAYENSRVVYGAD